MPGEFQGKVAVITGGSRGIGRGIAVALAKEGAQTVLVSSSKSNLDAAAKTVGAAGGPAPLTIVSDLKTLAGCQQVLDTVKSKFNRCDILVNSAGATKAGNFVDLPDEAWMDGYALKFFGCMRMCRLFWPMLKAAQGHVVNIGGGAARSPGADFTIGASVNAAMGNFSKGLSQLGKRDGVNVNVIHPGATETERFEELIAQRSKASGKSADELRKEATVKDGLRRLGKAEDVAALTRSCARRRRGTSRAWRSRSMAARPSATTEPMSVRAACVIGWPVTHSRSPLIHGHWIKQHGLAADYRREALTPEDVAEFFASLSARGYVGCNVTLPHKEAALAASAAGRPRARRRRGQYLVARWRPASLHQHRRRRLHQQSRRCGAGLGSRAEGSCGARRRRLGAGGGLWPDRARLCAHPRGQSHVRSRAGVARAVWRRGTAGQLVGAAAVCSRAPGFSSTPRCSA